MQRSIPLRQPSRCTFTKHRGEAWRETGHAAGVIVSASKLRHQSGLFSGREVRQGKGGKSCPAAEKGALLSNLHNVKTIHTQREVGRKKWQEEEGIYLEQAFAHSAFRRQYTFSI